MSRLVEGVVLQEIAERVDGSLPVAVGGVEPGKLRQQRDVFAPKALSRLKGPLLVRILGQESSRVQAARGLERLQSGLGSSSPRSRLELDHVHPHVVLVAP